MTDAQHHTYLDEQFALANRLGLVAIEDTGGKFNRPRYRVSIEHHDTTRPHLAGEWRVTASAATIGTAMARAYRAALEASGAAR